VASGDKRNLLKAAPQALRVVELDGFEGAERDVRGSGAVCVPFLSAVAARISLLAGLGAGLDAVALAELLAPWDATAG